MVRYEALKGLYEVEKTIGSGGFAKVKLATHIATGEKVAIKIMEKTSLKDDIPRIELELSVMKTVSHQHICNLYQVIETETHFFLILEYCSGGELFDHIIEKRKLTESESRMFFRQILSAIAYLHNLGYAHRDIKPENILLDYDQSLKLIDFGLCARPKGGINSPLSTSCGSPTYAAPELVLGKKYLGPEVDVWAMGILLYALLAGRLPFDDSNLDNLYRKIIAGNYVEPSWMSEGSRFLIRSMLQHDPKRRITVNQLLRHPWITMGILDPVDYSSQTNKYRDEECVELMAKNKSLTPNEMWAKISLWKYDYDTATYFLLIARKKRRLPLKMNLVDLKSTLTNADNDKQSAKNKNALKPVDINVLKSIYSPTQKLENATPKKSELVVKKSEISGTPKNENVLSPHAGNFVEPKRPNIIRKPQKRIRSPNVEGDCSPVPIKQRMTPGSSTPNTPSSEKKLTPGERPINATPGGRPIIATPGSAKKVILGSIERSFIRVRHVLTPGRGKFESTSSQGADQPQTLTTKGLCNVSTTQCSDPEFVITQLAEALGKRGIICNRKGFSLLGKMDPISRLSIGCSFELEICYLPQMASTTPIKKSAINNLNIQKQVGILRKRLKGDSWCYKKVCEQVLALTATGFRQKTESSV